MLKKAGAKRKTSIKKTKTPLKSHKTSHKPRITQTSSEVKVEKVLVENFISLQKVMTNLAVKFDNLSIQISKLLELFEISAKTLAEKDIKLDKGTEEKKMVEKLDTLLNQNKIIARGLTLLHESPEPMPPPQLMRQPAPQMSQQPMLPQRPPIALQPSPVKQVVGDGYQKSMPTKKQELSNPKPTRFAKKNEKVF